MKFVQIHVGDWEKGTKLCSVTEKGIYMDLLLLYYSQEHPIMRSQCERISRAYTNDEKKAFDYVLAYFFKAREIDGETFYFHDRCEEEIRAYKEKSLKAQASARSRWSKKGKIDQQTECDTDAGGMRSHMRSHCDGITDAMLTDNRKPITENNKESRRLNSDPNASLFSLEEAPKPEEAAESIKNPKVPAPDEIPSDWLQAAEVARPDIDYERAWNYFRSKYLPLMAKKTNWRTMASWHRAWMSIVASQFPKSTAPQNRQTNQKPQYKNPAFNTRDNGHVEYDEETGIF